MTRRSTARKSLDTDDAGRPIRPALTREFIIRTALTILDRDGTDGLSMRKLGAELGVNPMAVYHHLPNKAALFDGVVEAVYHELASALDALPQQLTWREQLATFARRLRETLRRHPNVLLVIATRPAYTTPLLTLSDRALGSLHGSGPSHHDLLVMISALRAYTIGQLLAEVVQPVGGPVASPDKAKALLDDYPNLARAVAGGYDPDAQYELVLRTMLDGFEQRLDGPNAPTAQGTQRPGESRLVV